METTPPITPSRLEQLGRRHRALVHRSRKVSDDDVARILDLGAAVVFHGAVEATALFELNDLLESSVVAELEAEHARLADDLGCLEELWASDPGSSDVATMARAVLERLRDHLERDQRIVYRSLARLGVLPEEVSPAAADATRR